MPAASDVSCATIGLRIEEISGIVGFPLMAATNVPRGCAYNTEAGPTGKTTTVEIVRLSIPSRSAFEETFETFSADFSANGNCAWDSAERSAFTCTGAVGPSTQEFLGASQSMVFLGDHTWQIIVGTNDASFVPTAEAGAGKLAEEVRERNL